jgi:HSP20 family protein
MLITSRGLSPVRAWDDLHTATNRLSRLFDEAFRSWPLTTSDNGALVGWMPPVDVLEAKDNLRIIAELPGVKGEDVKISLENNVLTIRGEKQQAAQESTERVHRYERCYGVFERSFQLPTTVDAEKIRAEYDSGVLTVTLPKVERARPREITVQVQKR